MNHTLLAGFKLDIKGMIFASTYSPPYIIQKLHLSHWLAVDYCYVWGKDVSFFFFFLRKNWSNFIENVFEIEWQFTADGWGICQ